MNDPLDLLTEADADTPDEYATPPTVRNLLRAITEAHAILVAPIHGNYSDEERASQQSDNLWYAADILAAALREYGIEPHTPLT